jgi:hypothetical protein
MAISFHSKDTLMESKHISTLQSIGSTLRPLLNESPSITQSAPLLTGEYFADSAIKFIGYSLDQCESAVSVYGSLPERQEEVHRAFLTMEYRESDTKSAFRGPLQNIMPFLTCEHEEEHHRIIATTPFGLLLWRIFQAIRVNMIFLRDIGGFNAEFFKHALNNIQRHSDFFLRTRRAPRTNRLGRYRQAICFECEVLRRYVIALLNGRGVSRGQFVDLANAAEQILGARSGLPFQRRIRVPEAERDIPLVSEGDLSPLEIMEATATLHEAQLLYSKHMSSTIIEQWKRESLHGVYDTAYRWFREKFGYTRMGKLAGDLGFFGPCDISSTQGEIDLSLFHPSHRLSRLANAVSAKPINFDNLRAVKQQNIIPFDNDVFEGSTREALSAIGQSTMWNDNFISRRAKDEAELSVEVQRLLRFDNAFSEGRKRQFRTSITERANSF